MTALDFISVMAALLVAKIIKNYKVKHLRYLIYLIGVQGMVLIGKLVQNEEYILQCAICYISLGAFVWLIFFVDTQKNNK